MSSHQPCSPQDRGNLEYDQLVRPALGGQEGTPLRSSSRVVSGSSRASEREGPQGVGVGACTEERPNPASTSNPNCPATPRQRGFSRLAGTSGCGPGTTRTTEPFPRRGTSPRAPPTQFCLQRNRRTPERAQNPKATSPGPCHAAPNHRRGPAGVRPPPGARAGRGRGVGAMTPGLGPTRTPARSRAGRHPRALSVASSVPQPEPTPAPNPGGTARVSGHWGPLRPRHPPALCSPPPLAPPRPPPPARPGLPPAPRRAPPAQQL